MNKDKILDFIELIKDMIIVTCFIIVFIFIIYCFMDILLKVIL
jgi:hypothetical protein